MPNCFGGDITKADLQKDDLVSVRAYQNAMEIQEMGASYVAMCCGFWYEWSLALGEPAYGIDIKNRTATFFDDGMTKFNTSTWIHCGQALAALLSLPVKKEGDGPALEDWKNGLFFISSFKISQKDMLESVHRVLGTKDDDWQIQYEPSEKRYKDALEEFKKGSHLGFAKALYSRSLFPGALDFGDQVVDRKLSLPEENLDEATKRAADMALSGWNPFA